ncbi:hypothetical protein NQ318_015474 [Aromia moschata]|uniref:Uncharacterized protein n=1 Tax=Aromia moschata TaxID=1265417 RepID=A0AAV8X400_9CUCU|nr:hypothetical protein NQ318_015474 [Aromia moschata]
MEDWVLRDIVHYREQILKYLMSFWETRLIHSKQSPRYDETITRWADHTYSPFVETYNLSGSWDTSMVCRSGATIQRGGSVKAVQEVSPGCAEEVVVNDQMV